jgi:hypothetical protein
MERIAGWAGSVLGWASVHLGWAPSTSSPIPNDFPILFQFKSKALSSKIYNMIFPLLTILQT